MSARTLLAVFFLILGLFALQSASQQNQAPATLPVYAADGSAMTGMHIVVGSVAVPAGGATVTLTGAAAFSSRDTYHCFTSIERGPVAGNPLRVDGTKFRLPAGPSGGWTEDFLCIGK